MFVLGCAQGALLPDDFSKPEIIKEIPNPSEAQSVQFFAFGDWGSASSDQIDVAKALASFCSTDTCDFGLLLGDNFYDSGVTSVSDPQWQSKFEDIYSQPSLQVPFYAVLGNHDHNGNAQAEIDYSSQQDRWTMPGPRYRIRFPGAADSSPLLEIFIFDSGYGDALPQEELDSLAADLDSSTAEWKILAMHHPIYSNGNEHGDTTAMDSTLIPVICNRVDVVLSGHDHLYSHLDDPNDGCRFQQWVVGTGGKSLYTAHADPRAIFSEDSSFGFASIKVQTDGVLISFHHTDQSIADSFLLTKQQ